MKFYTIYKTTNTVNGFIYIGKHKTDNPNDSYLGSGSLIRKAIQTYSKENFTKEVLHIFDTEEEMNKKEAELVTEEFVSLETNYNQLPGGHGGWSFINENKLNDRTGSEHKQSSRDKMGAFKGRTHTEETRKKLSESIQKVKHIIGEKTSKALTGKPKTEEHKRKISEALKRKNAGIV